MNSDKFEIHRLQEIALFSGLKDDDISTLSSIFCKEKFLKDAILFEENTDGDKMYIVLEGKIGIFIKGDAGRDNLNIATINEYQLVGEFVLVDQTIRSASAVCQADTLLISISRKNFYDLVDSHKDIGIIIIKNLATILCERLRETNIRLRNAVLFF